MLTGLTPAHKFWREKESSSTTNKTIINILPVSCSQVQHKLMQKEGNYWFLVKPGAHEPPKAAKEHATECNHNPNYVITFELNWLLSRVYGFKLQGCGFLIWKLVGYNGLWIWIVMAPGNLRKFHAPSLPSAMSSWLHSLLSYLTFSVCSIRARSYAACSARVKEWIIYSMHN